MKQNNIEQEQKRFEKCFQSMMENGKLMFAGKILQRSAKLFPDTIAIICKGEEITFKQLYYYSQIVTQKLKEMGVKPRDRVCLLCENSIEFYIAYYGIWQIGAVVVPLNTFLHKKELHHIIEDAQPKVIIVSADLYERLNEVNIEKLPPVIRLDEFDFTQPVPSKVTDIEIPELEPDEMAALLYTSGTTGMPKGVMLSSRNILTNVAQVTSKIDVHPDDRLYGILPLFHSFAQNACVWTAPFLGSTVVLVPKIERRWILEGLQHKPTVLLGVPALYGLLCLMKTAPLDTIRYFVSGGDALPDKIRAAFNLVYGRKICNGYGLTETSPFIAIDMNDELKQTSTIGKTAIGMEYSLRDEQGNEVQPGEVGILWVKGDNVMLGYYNAPETTKKVLQDGWLNTGDFAAVDEKGRLIISGRHKDLIISKGLNIYPQEIENILLGHPLIFKAGVVGKKDLDVGEIPIAFVAASEKKENLEKELKQLCAQNLAAYKIPRTFYILKDLPMTALAKVDKKKLKKEYLDQNNS